MVGAPVPGSSCDLLECESLGVGNGRDQGTAVKQIERG